MRNALFPILMLAVAGCSGGGRGDLSGAVTLDGQAIETGSILLVPADMSKGTSTGGEIKGGKFSLTGAQAPAAGQYKVEIRTNRKSGRKVQKAMGKPGELDDELVEAVAPRFNAKTELTVEIKSGSNKKDFAVMSK